MNKLDKPAYPVPPGNSTHYVVEDHYGLTRRELFAAMAMQGMMADPSNGAAAPEDIASVSIEQADALLEELDR
jgi:hypothetical protein